MLHTALLGDNRGMKDVMTVREVAKEVGICPRRVLTELVRLGWLPYPDPATQTYTRAQVESVLERFRARRAEAR